MVECSVRRRPLGGRGEWEFVPSSALVGRNLTVRIGQLSVDIPTEVYGTITASQGKPRLRKSAPNDRSKLHLVSLVMAIARLPDTAREYKGGPIHWPLESKGFIVSEMRFEVVSDDGAEVILAPLSAEILHSDQSFDLRRRFEMIREDVDTLDRVTAEHPALGAAVQTHFELVMAGVNTNQIRRAADGRLRCRQRSSAARTPHH